MPRLTWDNGHNDHVKHVVQEEGDGHRDQDQLPLVSGLLQRIPPLLSVFPDRLVPLQEGDVNIVDTHDDEVSLLVSLFS